jgi:hypothetical protein
MLSHILLQNLKDAKLGFMVLALKIVQVESNLFLDRAILTFFGNGFLSDPYLADALTFISYFLVGGAQEG